MALLCSTGIGVVAAHAQNATWVGGNGGDPNEWVEPANWSPASVPTGTATFGASGTTTVANDNGVVVIGAVGFTGAAPAYMINIDNPFIVTGAGVTNSSANTQTFNISDGNTLVFQSGTANNGTGAVTYNNSFFITFSNSSDAGNVNTTYTNNGDMEFNDATSANAAVITNNVQVDFFSTATAGSATITNATNGTITFNNSATAGAAVIGNSGAVDFNNSSTAGTASITNGNATLTFSNSSSAAGATIINNSGGTTTFGTSGGTDTATAGTANITNNSGGATNFDASTTAGTAGIIINNNGAVTFADSSTAGGATITNNSGGGLSFTGNSTAGSAAIGNANVLVFQNSASAGSAVINNTGVASFDNTSTAATSAITSSAGGLLQFLGSASAGSATITTDSGSNTSFGGSSSGGTSRQIVNTGGTLDISQVTAPSFTIGSLEGGGTVDLGGNALTVGGNNLSTTFSGVMQDGGTGGGSGASVVKTGTGTLTLTGANAYTGGTTISSGTLQLGNGGATGSIVGNVLDNANFAFNQTGTVTFGGVISGSGTVTQLGPGTLVLSNTTNSYSGGTIISAGALQVTAAGEIGGGTVTLNGGTFQAGAAGLSFGNAFAINPAGGTIDTQANTLTLTGVLADGTGAGALTKIGSGTLILTGSNTYSGGTTISAGTLQLGNGGTTGSVVGNIADNGALVVDLSSNATLNGAISGGGTLKQEGTGTLTLSGTSNYTGATTVAAGALDVTGALGNTAVTVQNGATLMGTGTIAGPVTIASGGTLMPGNGSPGTISIGPLTVNAGSFLSYELGMPGSVDGGNNSFTSVSGNLTINGGTVNVTPTGSFGPGVYELIGYSGTLGGGGSLAVGALPAGDTGVIQTAIPGEVNLVVSGATAITQFWDGATMTGDGTIHGGTGTWNTSNTNWTSANGSVNATWQNGFAEFAGAAGTVTVASAIQYQGLQFLTSGYVLAASGGGTLNPIGVAPIGVGSGLTDTITTPIAGSGGVQTTGTGTLVLSGANSYSGGTLISAGTLQVTNNSAVGTGTVTLDGGTFQAGANNLSFTVPFAINTTNGTIDTQANTLTISSAIANGNGAGALTKVGSGTLVLSGVNSYSGGTLISAGILQATNNNSVGSGAVTLGGGTFQAGASNLSFANAFAINTSGGTIDTQAGTLTLSGAIANGNGSGALTKIGSGILVLTGTDTYSGGTTISAGTLQIGNGGTSGSIIGSVADNGTLAFDRSDSALNFSGVISGSGTVQQIGAGTLILTGADTYSGGTTISSGTLQIGNGGTSGSIIGNVADNGILAFDRSDNALSLSGVISGNGIVQQNGTGAVTLSGANTYTGGTALNSGTIVVGNNAALGTGTLAMAAGTTLSFLSSGNFTIGNKITIAGDPNFTPPAGTTQTLSGVIANGASPGTLNMNGAGTLVLSAVNTYTGPTNVNSGTLDVTGSIASSSLTTVAGGATLTGNGAIGSLQISNGATLAPGSGTAGTSMSIAGNLAFQSGALYLVQVNPSSASSTNVTGTASLAGSVSAVFASGSYLTKQYTILQSAGLNGTTFSGLNTVALPSGFKASLAYTSGNVQLDLINATPISGLNVNQTNVLNALTGYFNSGGALPPGFVGVLGLTGPALANSLTQLDGEDATGAEHGAFELTNEFLGLMLDPFVYGRGGPASGGGALGFAPDQTTSFPPDVALAYAGLLKAPPKPVFDQRWTVWGAGYGGSGTFNGDPTIGSTNVTANTYGFAAGADYHATPDTVLGFALAGAGTNWGLEQGLGTGRSDAFQAGVYGTRYFGPAYLGAAFAFTNNWFTTDRTALGDELTARFQGQSYGVRAEGGYRLAVAPTMGVTPYAAIQAQSFHTPTYSETDLTGGGFGLTYNAMTATDTRSELGARFDALTTWGVMPVQLRARVAWAHDWVDDPALSAAFQALPGSSFVVNGAPVPHDSALTTVGAELHLAPQWTLIGKFDGEFANSTQIYAGSGTLRYTW